MPFARAGSRFTLDFEDLVGWLATTMDKTALRPLIRIDKDTTGGIIWRVMVDGLDPHRLDNLFVIGVDEAPRRKDHSYVTLVSSHSTGRFVWGKAGKDNPTLDCFFGEPGKQRWQGYRGSLHMHGSRVRQVRQETRSRHQRGHLP